MMTMATKQDIFEEHLEEYLKANRDRKGEILDHVCFVTRLHRKSATRRFRRLQMKGSSPPTKRQGRPVEYGPDVTAALRTVWEAGSEVCGELLHPITHEYIDILQRDGMWEHAQPATRQLRQMSEGTMKNRVGSFMKARKWRKGISATKPSALKKLIPIFTGPWHDKPPGYGQIDSVRHSSSASGDAVCTINYADASTMVDIPHAQLNLGRRATRDSMAAIQHKMPFTWLGAHPDTGSEYINHFVKDWCDGEGIELSRSRPNKKNDNMYVEERNGHVIRKYVGYITLDCQEAADALNELYDVLCPYLLHFVAVRRQVKRLKIKSKYVRQYEKKAKTPYQRILDHPDVEQTVKDKLKQEHQRLNPLVLKREIDRLTKKVYDTQQRYGSHIRRD